jgi:hypothetical protein
LTHAYISNELYHFVGRSHPENHEENYATLLKVLDSDFVSYPPHDRSVTFQIGFNWDADIFSGEWIVPRIICFCDIPFEGLGIHTKKYGKFGLSFSLEFLVKYGARPVIYMPLQPSNPLAGLGTIFCETLLKDIEQKYRGFYEQVVHNEVKGNWTTKLGEKPTTPSDAIRGIDSIITQHFLPFIKPFNSDLDENDPDNYYMEREWRKTENLQFQSENVKSILVAENYIERLKKDRPVYGYRVKGL